MFWVLFAVLAHAGNAVVFTVDKSLLGSGGKISQPVRYAFYSGLLAGAAALLLLIPSVYAPVSGFVMLWSAVAGLFHLAALWLFFSALKAGEPSRVVPIAGSAVPLFTFLFAAVALGEALMARQAGAVVLLILGGGLLSIRLGSSGRALAAKTLLITIASGALFAAYFATVKFLYNHAGPFLAVFVYSRVIEALLALALLGPLVWLGGRQHVASRKTTRRTAARVAGAAWLIPVVFVANKALAAGAFLLQNYAISLGSVTVVNALQGTQYVVLLLLAAAVSVWWPQLFREEFSRVAWWQKVGGVVLVSGGIALLI